MFGNESDDRTIAPTPRRLAEARRAGDVPRSREFTSAVAACAAAIVLCALGPQLWTSALELFQTSWSVPTTRFDDGPTLSGVDVILVRIAWILGEILSVPLLAALLATGMQAGFRPVFQMPRPRWSHVSPLTGWHRFWNGLGWFATGQLSIKIALAALITMHAVQGIWPDRSPSETGSAAAIAGSVGRLCVQCGVQLTAVLVVVSLADWFYRRRQLSRRLRLTPTEARQEARESQTSRPSRTRRSPRVSVAMASMAGSIEPTASVAIVTKSDQPAKVLRAAVEV